MNQCTHVRYNLLRDPCQVNKSEKKIMSSEQAAAASAEVNGITENVANLQLDSLTGEMVSKS